MKQASALFCQSGRAVIAMTWCSEAVAFWPNAIPFRSDFRTAPGALESCFCQCNALRFFVPSPRQPVAGRVGAHRLGGPHGAAAHVPGERAQQSRRIGGEGGCGQLRRPSSAGSALGQRQLLRREQSLAQAFGTSPGADSQGFGARPIIGGLVARSCLAQGTGSGRRASPRPALVRGRCVAPAPGRAQPVGLRVHAGGVGF